MLQLNRIKELFMENKIKIGEYELTSMVETQNDNFKIVDNRLYCKNKLVNYCDPEHSTVKFYENGAMMVVNFENNSGETLTEYNFYNNEGEMVFNTTNYDVDDEDEYFLSAKVEVCLYNEMLIAKIEENDNTIYYAVDYPTGKGFCGDKAKDVCADVMLVKKDEITY